jgi:hypothetical protein
MTSSSIARALVAALLALGLASASAGAQNRQPDAFTPLVIGPLANDTAPFQGDDGQFHVVYELWVTNAKSVPATIEAIEVLDAGNPARVVGTLTGDDLVRRMALLDAEPAGSAILGANESRIIFVELTFPDERSVPQSLAHHFMGTGATSPAATTPAQMSYIVGPWPIRRIRAPVLGPPLRGAGWVAVNGCCALGVHRSALQSINGDLVNSQRFAIDWMRLDEQGRFVNGDASRPESWASYDQPVLAVAIGRVVAMRNDLDDQPPGHLPDPESLAIDTVDGNYVVLDLGDNFFVFYAHMRKGSISVRVGQTLRAGQEIGRVGNSGNTSAPHLHLHVMAGASPLGANGLPYVFRAFTLRGQLDATRFAATNDLSGNWTPAAATPSQRANQLPLDLRVVEWPRTDAAPPPAPAAAQRPAPRMPTHPTPPRR